MRVGIAIAVLLYAAGASAATHVTKSNGVPAPACTSKELLDQFGKATTDRDTDLMRALILDGSCTLLPEGTSVSVLESSAYSGTSKIRAYLDGVPPVLWTYSGALAPTK